ncbi:MAG: hypothetical protein ACLQVK_03960 [Acidimicrobiales bacterium]
MALSIASRASSVVVVGVTHVRVLAGGPFAPHPRDRPEGGHAAPPTELGLDRVLDSHMATPGRRTQALLGEQRCAGFSGRVVGKLVRAGLVYRDDLSGRGQVLVSFSNKPVGQSL